VCLHMMAGSKEDAETVTAFFKDMKRRGLNDPLLVTSDGATGIIKAIEVVKFRFYFNALRGETPALRSGSFGRI
jgi:hypothetical protein